MKYIILICLIIVELFVNEFTLKIFAIDKSIGSDFVNKIRYFNLIIIIKILIIQFYFEDFKKLKISLKILYFLIFIVLIDFFSGFIGFGYKKIENDSLRYIFPYDWIRGEPNKLDHNKYGFRGIPPDFKREKNKITIGFFGGSTGYSGDPTIATILSKKLKNDNINNDIINFSSVSSNHNQHLHRLIEFSNYSYDLIIFYGGGNETIQQYYYDHRPGYPYNFYLFDTNPNSIKNLLIKHSNLIGKLDKIFSLYFKFNPKTSGEYEFNIWAGTIKNNYFQTLKKTRQLTEKYISPNKCDRSNFIAFFQPIISPNKRNDQLIELVRKNLKFNDVYDLSNLKDKLTFIDYIHIDQQSKEIVSNEIYKFIKDKLLIEKNC